MKVEVVQTACPAATGNYDITGTTPSGDLVGAIFLSAATTTDNTNVSSLRWGFGATDLINNIGIGQGGQDATSGAGIRSMLSTTNCLFTPTGLGGQSSPVGAYTGAAGQPANGIRLTTSAVTANRLTQTLLISGPDVQMKVGNDYFPASSTSPQTQTHNFGGLLDVLIVMISQGVPSAANESDGVGFTFGVYDRQSGNMNCFSYRATTGANPTDNAARFGPANSKIGQIINAAGSALANVTALNFTTTGFDLQFSANSGLNSAVGWIALRGSAAQMFSKNVLMSMPTAAGVANFINGMTGRPQCCIVLPTRFTSSSVNNSDDAGAFGIGLNATNDYQTTFQGSNSGTFQDGVSASSNAAHSMSNTNGIVVQQNTGVIDMAANIQNWNGDGVDFNVTNPLAAAGQAIVLAFGMPPVVSLPSYPGSRTQFMVRDQMSSY